VGSRKAADDGRDLAGLDSARDGRGSRRPATLAGVGSGAISTFPIERSPARAPSVSYDKHVNSRVDPLARLRGWLHNSPWVVMAVFIHVVAIAVLSVVYVGHKAMRASDEPVAIALARPKAEPLPDVPAQPEVIDRKAIPKNDDAEIVPTEDDVYVPTTEPTPEDLHLERGDPTALDNLPAEGTTGGSAIGVGEGGHYGLGRPSAFGGRVGRHVGAGRGGGVTQGTEKAVLDGLRWLVRHQNRDGSWSAATLKDHCPVDAPCFDPKARFTNNYDAGLTGLALLAFLGAGYSHESRQDIVDTAMARRYKIGEVVKKGLTWLVDQQNQDGSFSRDKSFIYNEALATLALTEAYGLTHNRYWKEPAQRGIAFIMRAQRPSPMDPNALWGWRYASRMEVEDVRKTTDDAAYRRELFDADTSATGWAVMALKSAQLSGLDVNKESMDGAFAFAKWVSGADGLVGYLDPRGAGAPVGGVNDQYVYHPGTMSAVDMCIRIFTQRDPDDAFLDLAAKRIVEDLPAISNDHLSIDYYYWYYGSLALNQFDGPDSPRKSGRYWTPWNKSMVSALLALQDHKERACSNGGWIVPDRWSYAGGPLYSTALNVLTLEVYYRYENAFGVGKHAHDAH
jgi:hypothetical protein